eukprot:c10769_g1_i3 orf=111-272(+)
MWHYLISFEKSILMIFSTLKCKALSQEVFDILPNVKGVLFPYFSMYFNIMSFC